MGEVGDTYAWTIDSILVISTGKMRHLHKHESWIRRYIKHHCAQVIFSDMVRMC